MANIVTGCRILCSIGMLFFPAFSLGFFILYLICGLTDMVDGTIARKTNTASEFGAKLDSTADFIFVAAALLKILPVLAISCWLWLWILGIALVKIANVISGFVREKRFMVEHTILNKMTGFLLFLLPLTVLFIELKYSAAVVCFVATFAAIQEGYYIWTGREIV